MTGHAGDAPGGRPRRVRVTGPRRDSPLPARRTAIDQIDAQSDVGEIYLNSLLRAQLRLALRILGLTALVAGSLPLVFLLFPAFALAEVGGVSVAWLTLGLGLYPVFVILGWWYVRAAEQNEHAFTDVVERR
ncbi:MAG: hypothetical protein ACRCYQ_10665 [Nocardioides sp.]